MYKYRQYDNHKVILKLNNNELLSFNENPENPDYQAYLAWVAEGNVAEEWNPNGN